MAGFAERLAAAKAKQGEAQERKAAEASGREREAKKSELIKNREGVQTELDKTEVDAGEAEKALAEADAFVKEQGEGIDAEAKAEIDTLKLEAGETLQKFQALKSELAKLDEEIASLDVAGETPVQTAVTEAAPAEQPADSTPESGMVEKPAAEKSEAVDAEAAPVSDTVEKPIDNAKEIQAVSALLDKIKGKEPAGNRSGAIIRFLQKLEGGAVLEKDGPQAIARLGSQGAEMLRNMIDEETAALYAKELEKGNSEYTRPPKMPANEALARIKGLTFGYTEENVLKPMQTIEGMRNGEKRQAAIANVKENLNGKLISQRDKGKRELGELLSALDHDPDLKKTFIEELGTEAMEQYKKKN